MMRNVFKKFLQSDKVPARYLLNAIPELDLTNKNFRYNAAEGFVWKSNYIDDVNTKTTINNFIWKDLDKWKNKIALVCTYLCEILKINLIKINQSSINQTCQFKKIGPISQSF